jgi:hypothetical protein
MDGCALLCTLGLQAGRVHKRTRLAAPQNQLSWPMRPSCNAFAGRCYPAYQAQWIEDRPTRTHEKPARNLLVLSRRRRRRQPPPASPSCAVYGEGNKHYYCRPSSTSSHRLCLPDLMLCRDGGRRRCRHAVNGGED